MLMATWKVAPALAAGCAAILKPSELASVYVLLNLYELVQFYFWFFMLNIIIFKISEPVWSWLKFAERSVFLLVSLIF